MSVPGSAQLVTEEWRVTRPELMSTANDPAPGPPKKSYEGYLQCNHRREYRPIAGARRNPNHLKGKLTSFFYSVRDDHHFHRQSMSPQLPCDPRLTKNDED